MKYMGSKAKITKFIVPIIQQKIEESGSRTYLEPFAGGCNVIDKVNAKYRVASDKNEYLIALFKYLQVGGELPEKIEHIYPDYGLYGITNTAYGFLTRGCPRNCDFCIVGKKEGLCSRKVADLREFWKDQKEIKLLDPNILAAREHKELLEQLASSGAWVDFTQGLDARLLTEENIEIIKRIKLKMVHFAWDNIADEKLIVPKLQLFKEKTGIDKRKCTVYVLTNFNSTLQEDLHRIYKIRDLGMAPFVMVYEKQTAPKEIKDLQRWVNNRIIWYSTEKFEDYRGDTKTRRQGK